MNTRLNYGGDPDHRLNTRIVFRIRHYWEIRKVVNGYSLMPDGGTGKTCLGGGLHCPSASSYFIHLTVHQKRLATELPGSGAGYMGKSQLNRHNK